MSAVAGTGGLGGAGGLGGVGGLPSSPATCHSSTNSVDVILVGSDGNLVTTSFDDQVVVVSVGRCVDVGCTPVPLLDGAMMPVSSTDHLHIVFDRSSGGSLTLYLKVPQMPMDALKVGDAYDLVVDASVDVVFQKTVDQTVTLLGGGRLVVFAAQLRKFGLPPFPDLGRAGIALEDGGVVCNDSPGGPASSICGVRQHAVRVTTAAGTSAVVQPGQTTGVSDLSFTSDSYEEHFDTGNCDAKSVIRMAAFASSPCSGAAPGCVYGPSSCCGDVLMSSSCNADGQWACPAGYVPVSACTGYANALHSGPCPL